MQKTLPCPKCEKACLLSVVWYGEELTSVTGHLCPVGVEYARSQVVVTLSTVSTSVRVEGGTTGLVPVRTHRPVDKSKTIEIIREAGKVSVKAPIRNGQVVVRNVAGAGADLVAIKAVEAL